MKLRTDNPIYEDLEDDLLDWKIACRGERDIITSDREGRLVLVMLTVTSPPDIYTVNTMYSLEIVSGVDRAAQLQAARIGVSIERYIHMAIVEKLERDGIPTYLGEYGYYDAMKELKEERLRKAANKLRA